MTPRPPHLPPPPTSPPTPTPPPRPPPRTPPPPAPSPPHCPQQKSLESRHHPLACPQPPPPTGQRVEPDLHQRPEAVSHLRGHRRFHGHWRPRPHRRH